MVGEEGPLMARKNTATVNKEALRQLFTRVPAARAILEHLAGLEQNPRHTPLDALERACAGFGRAHLVYALRVLEELGCGRFVVGRKGYPSRFEWAYDARSIGKVGMGTATQVSALDGEDLGDEDETSKSLGEQAVPWSAEQEQEGEGPPPSFQEIPEPMYHHRFRLRRGLEIVLALPESLTTSEAERLAAFIKTLPLG